MSYVDYTGQLPVAGTMAVINNVGKGSVSEVRRDNKRGEIVIMR